MCGFWVISRYAVWIRLFLNSFNHYAGTLVHMLRELSTNTRGLSTIHNGKCSEFVQVNFDTVCHYVATSGDRSGIKMRQGTDLLERIKPENQHKEVTKGSLKAEKLPHFSTHPAASVSRTLKMSRRSLASAFW